MPKSTKRVTENAVMVVNEKEKKKSVFDRALVALFVLCALGILSGVIYIAIEVKTVLAPASTDATTGAGETAAPTGIDVAHFIPLIVIMVVCAIAIALNFLLFSRMSPLHSMEYAESIHERFPSTEAWLKPHSINEAEASDTTQVVLSKTGNPYIFQAVLVVIIAILFFYKDELANGNRQISDGIYTVISLLIGLLITHVGLTQRSRMRRNTKTDVFSEGREAIERADKIARIYSTLLPDDVNATKELKTMRINIRKMGLDLMKIQSSYEKMASEYNANDHNDQKHAELVKVKKDYEEKLREITFAIEKYAKGTSDHVNENETEKMDKN